MLTFNMFY